MAESKRAKSNRVTVKDLAKDLGMSVSTVSRAFYPDAVIKKETREAVLKRAKEIGYRPNPYAQSLITKKTQIVGMIVSDLPNPFYPEVMTQLSALFQKEGMNVMLAASHEPALIDDAVDLMLSYQPDVIVILAVNLGSDALDHCEKAGAPVIFFNRLSADGRGHGVSCDNVLGGSRAADYLIENGHKNLAYVAAFPDASTNQERMRGFCSRVIERGLRPPAIIQAGRFSYEAGYEAGIGDETLEREIDGVFCANDIVAIGFIEGLQEAHGLRIPEDISVIGFDNITMAGWPSHKLTTIPQPADEMMQATVQLAKALANDKSAAESILRLEPGEVIERSTTRARLS